MLDVGGEHLHRDLVEGLDHGDEQERDDHRGPAGAEPVAERHHLAAHAGQEIVGEDLAGLGLGLRVAAHLLLAEDDGGQRRNVIGL